MFEFGQIINKRYIFVKSINSGAFSSVWLMFDISKNNICIAKVINEEDKETGENEIKILNKIKRLSKNTEIFNNLLLFTENIIINNQIIIIEDYQNLTLKDLIYDFNLSPTDKKTVITNIKNQLIPVICFLKNNKLLHADIKPENIFLSIPDYQNLDINDNIKNFLSELSTFKPKKQKYKFIQSVITKYKKILLDKFIDDVKNDLSDSSDFIDSAQTDSDIHSDYDESEKINDFLVDKILEYKNNDSTDYKTDKKIIDFDIKNITYLIGDFGNTIDYSKTDNYKEIINLRFHDLQTRYYRHPNIIMRSENILDSDFYAFDIIIKEIENLNLPFDPAKSHGETTDHNHLRCLINNDYKIQCEKGRKTKLFFNHDKITNIYYLGK